MPNHFDLLLRIAIGGILGGLIGLERNLHSRHVVLRTHILVSVASASFMIVSIYFVYFQDFKGNMLIEVDGSRIAASVVSGIGFLAGGVILKSGATVQGLTTAASLWLATAVGLMSGSAMFTEAGFVALIGVSALALLRRFEEKREKFLNRKVLLSLRDENQSMKKITDLMNALGVKMSGLNYERTMKNQDVELKFSASIPVALGVSEFIRRMEEEPCIRHLKVKTAE